MGNPIPSSDAREAATRLLLGPKVFGGDGGTYVLRSPNIDEAAEAFDTAIRKARADAYEQAARVADPPLMHRKGKVGIWRRRRAEIATAIRALSTDGAGQP